MKEPLESTPTLDWWAYERYHTQIIETKKSRHNHTHKRRTTRIYVVQPYICIHGQQWGENFTNKYGDYKGSVEALSQNANPKDTQRALSCLYKNYGFSMNK